MLMLLLLFVLLNDVAIPYAKKRFYLGTKKRTQPMLRPYKHYTKPRLYVGSVFGFISGLKLFLLQRFG